MREAARAFLVLNAGSSSLKFGLYAADDLAALCRGGIGGIGLGATFKVKGAVASAFDEAPPLPRDESQATVVGWLLQALRDCLPDSKLVAAGHRVVHGGRLFDRPVVIDDAAMAALADFVALAPAHQPHNLAAIRAVAAAWPGLPQVACFDTAFHFGQPRLARMFGLPRLLSEQGIVRYGFHGLSYEYIAKCMSDAAGIGPDQRVVVAHLGHGASLCAMHDGRSVATTMGFTTMDGLVMGKRCGTLDPGVVLYLMREKRLSVAEVDELLNERSGLFGVSGISDDVRRARKPTPPKRSISSPTGRHGSSVRSLRRSAASTHSSLLPASGSIPPRCGRASAVCPPGPGSSWTTPPTRRTGRASPPRPLASAPSSFRPTRRS